MTTPALDYVDARVAGAVEVYGYGRERDLIAKLLLLGCTARKDGTGKVLDVSYRTEDTISPILQWWCLSRKWVLFTKNLPHGFEGTDFEEYVVRKELLYPH